MKVRVQELAEARLLQEENLPPEEGRGLLLLRWKMRERLELESAEQSKWLMWLLNGAKAADR